MKNGRMNTKRDWLKLLRDQKERWEALITGLSEEQIMAPDLPDGWAIKDVLAHLMAWQQITNARLRAALRGLEPVFPGWPEELDPDADEDLETINAWIYATHRDRNWSSVYQEWRSGFQRVLDTALSVPESLLTEAGRFSWLVDQPLMAVLQGMHEHHQEHLDTLQAWLAEQS